MMALDKSINSVNELGCDTGVASFTTPTNQTNSQDSILKFDPNLPERLEVVGTLAQVNTVFPCAGGQIYQGWLLVTPSHGEVIDGEIIMNESTELEAEARKIERLKGAEAASILEIGKILTAAKQKLKENNQGWLNFLQDPRVDIEPRTAQRYMRLGTSPDGAILARLGVKKADILLRLDLEQRQKLMDENDLASITAKELEKMISALLAAEKLVQAIHPNIIQPSNGMDQQFIWYLGVLQINLCQIEELSAPLIEDAHYGMLRLVHYEIPEHKKSSPRVAHAATELVDEARDYLLKYISDSQSKVA